MTKARIKHIRRNMLRKLVKTVCKSCVPPPPRGESAVSGPSRAAAAGNKARVPKRCSQTRGSAHALHLAKQKRRERKVEQGFLKKRKPSKNKNRSNEAREKRKNTLHKHFQPHRKEFRSYLKACRERPKYLVGLAHPPNTYFQAQEGTQFQVRVQQFLQHVKSDAMIDNSHLKRHYLF